ncbi:MAG: MgtC/SapB family protein [Proteobacteria bacterium]|nr:MAG: MgtC/SapB family protein [Pseudomonadota bacterium]QKK11455.1 MAG: MgtC/SapB family protein [Pseudomonadota bacterium]
MPTSDIISILSLDTLVPLLVALVTGGLIGLERTSHGRPAGFRTHALVCVSSSLLMLVATHQLRLMGDIPLETIRIDPTRMGQGVMTGIGFLGAGVVMKEGLTIRGLTTAASIWMTAAIGILLGLEFYVPAMQAAVISLVVLSLFRWVENAIPSLHYGNLSVRFAHDSIMPQAALQELIMQHGITAANPSYSLKDAKGIFEYVMIIRTRKRDDFRRLAETLAELPQVREFSINTTGD